MSIKQSSATATQAGASESDRTEGMCGRASVEATLKPSRGLVLCVKPPEKAPLLCKYFRNLYIVYTLRCYVAICGHLSMSHMSIITSFSGVGLVIKCCHSAPVSLILATLSSYNPL